jgi:hypothetical protein
MMKSVASNGGPLIALPAEVAKLWRGTDAPPGVPVPKGWEWSGDDDDPIRTDYDRAIGKLRAFHESSYGGGGLLKVGETDALVFARSTDTTFLPLADGGVFLRNMSFSSPAVARMAVSLAPKWKKTRVELTLKDGRLIVLDAACSYRDRPAALTAKLRPGRYRMLACDWMPEGSNDHEIRGYRLEAV